ARQLLDWNNIPPKTYARVNALKFLARPSEGTPDSPLRAPHAAPGPGDLLTRWRAEEVDYDVFTRDWTGENLVFELKSHPSLSRLGSFQEGWFYVQDPSTLLAPVMLDPQPGESILDLCAAPGGKTTFIAQLMQNRGRIFASDPDPNRWLRLKENCVRLGVACVDFHKQALAAGEVFDRVLVDAPCSNTGVLRRRVDLRWRIQAAEIERLRATQLSLLNQAAARLKPGGLLVYSTCSLEPEENSGVVNQFLADRPGFQLQTQRQLLPFADGVDGAYVALLKGL
ncbi:MAG TPA: RsmB/NOP family class I SAM-dependent RNA methyltransferase, partial [Candidatus Acidoferrales bacterium]|nr:RsmB/NOP family class I SAM-dependent RNA methyltransferase [Candidatus Acidoferrales bacterium]